MKVTLKLLIINHLRIFIHIFQWKMKNKVALWNSGNMTIFTGKKRRRGKEFQQLAAQVFLNKYRRNFSLF